MRAYYNESTGYVVKFAVEVIEGFPYIEVADDQVVVDNLNSGLIGLVKDGSLVFESDRALSAASIRSQRNAMLVQADAYLNMLNDTALIDAVPVETSVLQKIAIYRQALRQLAVNVDIQNVDWPIAPW